MATAILCARLALSNTCFMAGGTMVGEYMDEVGLIRRAQFGDVSAFNGLVRLYQGMVYNVARHLVDDAEMAADITQEALLKAFRALADFQGGSFRAWLTRIATNLSHDYMRYER